MLNKAKPFSVSKRLILEAHGVIRFVVVVCMLFDTIGCVRYGSETTASARSDPKSRPVASQAQAMIFAGDILGVLKLVKYVRPEYPDWARQKHLEGTVELMATIGKDGSLRDLTFVKEPQELVPYAQCADGDMSPSKLWALRSR